MFNKAIWVFTAAALLMVASFNMAQQAATPTTTPATNNAAARAEASRQTQLRIRQKMLQKTLATIKTDLGCSDEDFTVLQPLIENCITTRDIARQSNDTGSFGVARVENTGTHGPHLSVPTPGETAAARALQDLDILLHDPNATQTAIQAQMKVVREKVKEADDAYAAACKDLRALVTRRQEVVLFLDDVLN